MIDVCAIASGSNGNCYYVGNDNGAVLVDAGINCKQILLRMEGRGLDAGKVKALFITHEHLDHARGARVLCKKLNITAYMTYGTYNNLPKEFRPDFFKIVKPDNQVEIDDITIHPFRKKHDAAEPCSFRIETQGQNIGVITDVGSVCENVINNLKLCETVFLESNYDEKMLWGGRYTWVLKQRIASEVGHLSNMQALELIEKYADNNLKTIILSHLSGENNSPELALESFQRVSSVFNVIATSRHEASAVYHP